MPTAKQEVNAGNNYPSAAETKDAPNSPAIAQLRRGIAFLERDFNRKVQDELLPELDALIQAMEEELATPNEANANPSLKS